MSFVGGCGVTVRLLQQGFFLSEVSNVIVRLTPENGEGCAQKGVESTPKDMMKMQIGT
jgi:hypothetical protein